MEVRKKIKGGSAKGQLMTIVVLVFVMLMISALVVFVAINIGYDSISQTATLSSGVSSFSASLQKSSDSFAYSSGLAALSTLTKYEMNPSLRKSNFISNFSAYMQYLMTNATLPNVPANSIAANAIMSYMSNSTLKSYNSIISSQSAFGSRQVHITETKPLIFQQNPYSISVSYTEYVSINASTGTYAYTLPVNVSIPINNTPDLFYAQQGIYRPIRFSQMGGLVTNIGNDYATIANSSAFVYGTAYVVPSPSSCGSSLGIPAALSAAPYNSQIILVTSNAVQITSGGCTTASLYGGLITNYIGSAPSVPYLVYSNTNNALNYIQTGQTLLLYGPGMDTLNTTGLLSAITSQRYFTSSFFPSYSDRAAGNLQVQSPYGISTFSTYGRQAAIFSSAAVSGIISTEPQSGAVSYTISAWVYPETPNGIIAGGSGSGAGHSLVLGIGNVILCGGVPGTFFMADNAVGIGIGVNTIAQFPLNRWYFIVGTFNSLSGTSVSPSQFSLYINGARTSSGTLCNTGSDTTPLGSQPATTMGTQGFGGLIANMQIYNNSLTAYQIQHLYQQGIEALPISNSPLMGWYGLNGNANDNSGNGYSTAPNSISYSTLPAYNRDSLMPSNISQYYYPIPGIGLCNNNAQCSSSSAPNLYLGDSPLQIGSSGTAAAYFNGQTSYIEQGAGFNALAGPTFPGGGTSTSYSVSIWVYPLSGNGVILDELGQRDPNVGWHYPWIELGSGSVYMDVPTVKCVNLGQIPIDQWSNIVITSASSGPTAYTGYINGFSTGNKAGTRLLPSGPSVLNMYYPLGQGDANTCNPLAGGPYYYAGLMSNYQFYNVQLSAAAANAIFMAGISGSPVNQVNLTAWYPLNGNANDYSGHSSATLSNQISYVYLPYNYSSASAQAGTSIQSGGTGTLNNEWQSLGLGAKPLQQVLWNVSAWTPGPALQFTPYTSVTPNPLDPSGVTPTQVGSWYSGLVGGTQSWNYATGNYSGSSFIGVQQSHFPQSLSSLESKVACSGTFNSTGYTATTNISLSGTYRFQIVSDDAMEIFYRPQGGSWSSVFGGAAWNAQRASVFGPVSVNFPSGNYQLAVDWMNQCNAGLSDFMMSR